MSPLIEQDSINSTISDELINENTPTITPLEVNDNQNTINLDNTPKIDTPDIELKIDDETSEALDTDASQTKNNSPISEPDQSPDIETNKDDFNNLTLEEITTPIIKKRSAITEIIEQPIEPVTTEETKPVDKPSSKVQAPVKAKETESSDKTSTQENSKQSPVNTVEGEQLSKNSTNKTETVLKRVSTKFFSRKKDNDKNQQSLSQTGRKKVVLGVLSALLVSTVILFSGYYYYVEQINNLDNNVNQFTTRPLTPVGAVPPEEADSIAANTHSDETSTNHIAHATSVSKPHQNASSATTPAKNKVTDSKPAKRKQIPKKAKPALTKKIRQAKSTAKPRAKKIRPRKTKTLTPESIKRQQIENPIQTLLTTAFNAFQAGNDTKARENYFAVLELDQNNRDALLGLAAIAVRHKDFKQAQKLYTRLIKRDQGDSVARAALVGLVGQLDPVKAETELKLMLEQEPGAAYLHFALGNTYALQQRWLEAQNSFFNAYRSDSTNPDYAYNVAVSLDHLGEPSAAIKYYKQALMFSSNKKVSFNNRQVQQRIESLSKNVMGASR